MSKQKGKDNAYHQKNFRKSHCQLHTKRCVCEVAVTVFAVFQFILLKISTYYTCTMEDPAPNTGRRGGHGLHRGLRALGGLHPQGSASQEQHIAES